MMKRWTDRLADLTAREPVGVGASFVALLIIGVAWMTDTDPMVIVSSLIAIVGIFTQVRQAVTPYAKVLADLVEMNEGVTKTLDRLDDPSN